MTRVNRACAGLACGAALGALAVIPAGASAAGKTGLACLQGSWVSGAVSSKQVSGLSGIKLGVTVHGSSATGTANYNNASGLKFTGTPYTLYLRGTVAGTFHFSHGSYSFSAGASSEKYSFYAGSTEVVKPTTVSQIGSYQGMRCSGNTLSVPVSLKTKSGTTINATEPFKRG